MHETVEIAAGDLAAAIVPSLGGGVARFDLKRDGSSVPLLRPWPDSGTDDPNQLGCYVLVPWSNRVSGGGFKFGGRFHPLLANLAGEAFPIHGNGWTSRWTLTGKSGAHAALELASEGPGPYRYRATLEYLLDPDGMVMRATIANQGDIALPFGAGFHPWFPRTPATRLCAPAASVWLEDSDHLPSGTQPVSLREHWDFSLPQALPQEWINNGFTGWNGRARIEWRDRALALEIEASPPLTTYILFSPGKSADFFCFEPVSHVVDAHNLPGGPTANGLVILGPGKELSVSCRFRPRVL
jgi:aldose 1-epimerase